MLSSGTAMLVSLVAHMRRPFALIDSTAGKYRRDRVVLRPPSRVALGISGARSALARVHGA